MLGLIIAVGVAWGAPTEWRRALDSVVPGVVVIKTYGTRAFDTERSGPSVATGFIVDKERGIIVSNRHVVKPGPTVAEAHFQDNEEIPLQAIYRDPVHDFGFYRFDPDSVRFMEVVELPLVPNHAEVGSEIRLVGNDAGEKISILDGTLARLDRPAPVYGRARYNDFNTFYYQAASGSSGGSSGSPVVDVHGHVIALNAGSKRRGASSYFLPLDRVVRALEKIQAGEPVTRGSLQVTFKHDTFDEVQRLGLSDATHARLRKAHPEASGLLTVRDVLPEGPAYGKLQPGDVVVGLDGASITGFVALETILDDGVGQTVVMDIEREGTPLRVEMEVADLHQVTPSSFLEVGGSIVHPLSYQMARHYEIPIRGLMLAKQGYMFRRGGVPGHAVLLWVNDQPVPTLDALQAALEGVPDRAEVPVRYFLPQESRRMQTGSITMDRRWFPMRRCALEEGTGRWPCVDMPTAPPTPPRAPQTASTIQADKRAGKALAKSLVQVQFSIPLNSDGVIGMSFRGAGLIVDAEAGLVITDRDTVPVLLGDVRLTFGGSVEIPGEVVALHPGHNLALVSYDPAHIGQTEVRQADFVSQEFATGDEVRLVGMRQSGQLLERKGKVSDVDPLFLPTPTTPAFRPTNVDLVALQDSPPHHGRGAGRQAGPCAGVLGLLPESLLAREHELVSGDTVGDGVADGGGLPSGWIQILA